MKVLVAGIPRCLIGAVPNKHGHTNITEVNALSLEH
jgi:hypothetical protein